MRQIFLLLLVLSVCVAGNARTPFTKPVRPPRVQPSGDAAQVAPFDTVWQPAPSEIRVAGYEKTLRSTRESMYISNSTDAPVAGLGLEVTYYDTDGRMLHRASHDITADIPGGETRLVDIPSFDRQNLYYYYLSPVPPRASRATPFKTSVEVKYILTPKFTE